MPTPSRAARLPAPTDDARLHSERLAARIRDEIEAGGGWMDFARFMELTLYAPGLGYYAAGATKLGKDGDFITAPELSPLFGRTLARQVAQVLEEAGGEVLELGAGSGVMAADVLDEMRGRDRLPERYSILEPSPELAQRQRDLLRQRHPDLHGRIDWIASLPHAFEGVIVANEVLDALPVHLIAWRSEGLFERGVAFDGGFAWAERGLAPGALRDAAEALAPGIDYISEVSLAVPALVRDLAAVLRKGALLFVDYGFGRREYYHPQRSTGTLMCHYRHHAHDDPFHLPGLQDLTAHVDFTAVAEAGIDANLKLMGYTTQAQFLINCGITQMLERESGGNASRFAAIAAAQKLLSPAEMGELFKAIMLGRGLDAAPVGFSSGDKSRLL
ncbi:MAG TPA: SAM-dependent methyltransferase [Burkholderiales bacterium]|nr:SAM-dependent methyltransferase [Burkholderiales bacterium]